jgi:hypothetical protein
VEAGGNAPPRQRLQSATGTLPVAPMRPGVTNLPACFKQCSYECARSFAVLALMHIPRQAGGAPPG